MNPPQEIETVLLAGGKGARLHPYTAIFPKPLMPLGDMPVLEVLLRRLSHFGLNRATLCTGHLAEMIQAFFGDGGRFGVRLRYSREDQPLGTAGPIGLVDDLTDPFMVMNGDLLTTLNFHELLAAHQSQNADATIATYRRDVQIDLGVLKVAPDGTLADYLEKPVHHFEVSMGVYVFSRRVRERIEPGRRLDIPELILGLKNEGKRVICHRCDCTWLDIGRADDYAEAQEQFQRDRAVFLPETSENRK